MGDEGERELEDLDDMWRPLLGCSEAASSPERPSNERRQPKVKRFPIGSLDWRSMLHARFESMILGQQRRRWGSKSTLQAASRRFEVGSGDDGAANRRSK
eukprot:3659721-Rhodomonas_salina.1